MNNISKWDDFKNKKNSKPTNESAQIIDDVWKVRTRFEIPVSLVNAFIKKVKDETSKNIRETYSDQEIAEEIANYVKSAYLNIANLPSKIIVGEKGGENAQTAAPVQNGQVQSQEGQSQDETQPPAQEGQAQGQTAQTQPAQGQGQAQKPAQGQGQAQKTASEVPAQEI